MPEPQRHRSISPTVAALANALVESMVHPALIVADGAEIIAANPKWLELAAAHSGSRDPPALVEHESWLKGTRSLTVDLLESTANSGSQALALKDEDPARRREFIARWRRLGQDDGAVDRLALVLLEDHEVARRLSAVVRNQQVRIDELLVRQTVIEERQRRLLGAALHDHVSQLLAHARRCLADEPAPARSGAKAINLIDEAITAVRDVTFAISPPILEDLGLLPALRWLVDDLRRRHGMDASFIDDGREPALTHDARIVVFRAIRELANNAVKHAPGAEIVISSLSNHAFCRFTVRDFGPGFDGDWSQDRPDGRASYGLQSVDQQILALGGAFEMVSVAGEGARAVLILPLTPPKAPDRNPEPAEHA